MANKKVYEIELDGVKEAIVDLANLQKKEAELENDLKGLTKGTVAYTETQLALAEAQKEVAEATKELTEETEEQGLALNDMGGIAGEVQQNLEQVRGAVSKLGSQFKTLSGAIKGTGLLLLVGLVTSVGSALADGRKATREFQIAFQSFASATRLVGERLIATFQSLFASIENKFLGLELLVAKLPEYLGGSAEEVERLNKEIAQNESQIQDLSVIWEGWTDDIGKNNDAIRERLELEDQLVVTLAQREVELQKLQAEEEVLALQSEDSTTSLRVQQKALDDLTKKQQERLNFQQKTAQLEQDIILKNIEVKLREIGLAEQFTDAQITSLKFLNDKRVADKLSNEDIEALTQNTLALKEANLQLSIFEQQNAQTRRQNLQDEKEIELDFAIDTFENQKGINERRIADENKVFAEKQRILEETRQLADVSFQEQGNIIQEFTDKQLNLQELVETKDATQLAKKIKDYELSEILENRLREVIQERRLVLEDLDETDREIKKQEVDRIRAVEEAEQELLIFREEQNVKLLTGTRERLQGEIELIELRYSIEAQKILENVKDKELADQQLLLLEEKKNAEINALNKANADEEDEARKERLQAIGDATKELLSQLTEFASELLARNVERRQELLDEAGERVAVAEERLEASRSRAEEIDAEIRESTGARREFLIEQADKERKAEQRLDKEKEKAKNNELKRKKELEDAERKQAKFQFGVDLAEALSSGALAITRVLSATSGDPTGVLRAIQLAIVSTTTALQVATITAQANKFADGGYTGRGFGSPDETGFKPAGVVHEDEYVVPSRVLNTSEGSRLVGRLEGMRTRKFAEGGFTSPNFAQATVDLQNNSLAQQINTLTAEVSRINSTPVEVVATEVADVNSRVATIKEGATL